MIQADGSKIVLIIRRLRCSQCGKNHNELPDILIPFKRHCAETIENIIEGKTGTIYIEGSTISKIRAWWFSLLLYFQNILASLESKYGVRYPAVIKPREVARALANAHLWIHTRSACAP